MDRKLRIMRAAAQKKYSNLLNETEQSFKKIDNHLGQICAEQKRVTKIANNPWSLINEIDDRFKQATKLTDLDINFLFLATALQCVRQYVLTAFPVRLNDQEAANQTIGHFKEHSSRSHRYYAPSLEEIITNPVPFDAITGGKGILSGYGYLGHRGATIGHDPVLGLVVGTSNIATSTLTTWDFNSYHIVTGYAVGRNGTPVARDIFGKHANTLKVLTSTTDKLLHQGLVGKQIVGISLLKEIIHLQSDLNTKRSLPLPLVSLASPQLAGEMARHGLDMANAHNVGKQLAFAVLLDTFIAMLHGLYYDESVNMSRKAYEIRTRRILCYSNLIATSSNIVVTACTQNIARLDVGGIANTLFRFLSDARFIHEVKRDFLKNEFHDRIVGKEYEFMEGD